MFWLAVRNALINIFRFLAIAMWFLFAFYCMWSFINLVIMLKYYRFQTVGYIVYSLLLLLLSVAIMWSPKKLKKRNNIKYVCYAMSALFAIVTIADLINYKCFIGYNFLNGDAIFSNLIVNLSNIWGSVCCFAIAVLYYLFGKYLYKKKWLAVCSYFLIFAIDGILPIFLAYTGIVLLRMQWVEKAAFILPQQLFTLFALAIPLTNRNLWLKSFT